MSAGFWLFCCCFYCFFVFFCMIWSNIIIFSPPEHKKHHLNLKWGDLIFWFRPISCTHFATPQHMCPHISHVCVIPICSDSMCILSSPLFLLSFPHSSHLHPEFYSIIIEYMNGNIILITVKTIGWRYTKKQKKGN